MSRMHRAGGATLVAAALILCPAAIGFVAAQAQIVMKIATVNAAGPRNEVAGEFIKVITEKSGGKIKAELFPNNQLARGEGAMLEGVQLGAIDLAPVGSAPIGGIFEPAFLPLDLPFLWTSREHVWRVVDGPIGQEWMDKVLAAVKAAQ